MCIRDRFSSRNIENTKKTTQCSFFCVKRPLLTIHWSVKPRREPDIHQPLLRPLLEIIGGADAGLYKTICSVQRKCHLPTTRVRAARGLFCTVVKLERFGWLDRAHHSHTRCSNARPTQTKGGRQGKSSGIPRRRRALQIWPMSSSALGGTGHGHTPPSHPFYANAQLLSLKSRALGEELGAQCSHPLCSNA